MTRRGFLESILWLVGTPLALAHPGNGPHQHEIQVDAEEAALLAKDAVIAKIQEGKLGTVWSAIQPNPPRVSKFGTQLEWVVTFDNPAMSDAKKRRLYVFLKLNGQLSAVNFSGK